MRQDDRGDIDDAIVALVESLLADEAAVARVLRRRRWCRQRPGTEQITVPVTGSKRAGRSS